MRSTLGKTLTVCAAGAALILCSATACETTQDAPVSQRDMTGAELVNMPDGFSNVATKCSHGNRVYVAYHGDSAYGAVAVVGQDPTCKGQ